MKARTVIDEALQEIRVNGSGEVADSADLALALQRLNGMLDAWSIEPSSVIVPSMLPVPLTVGQAVYTVGPTGNVITARPALPALGSFVRYLGTDIPIDFTNLQDYNGWAFKATPGWPSQMYYAQTIPDATITLFPVPSNAGMVLYLANAAMVASFPDYDTDVPFAPGYLEALRYNLAVRLANPFSRPVSKDLQNMAAASKRRVKAANLIVPTARIDPVLTNRWNSGNGWVV